MTLLERMRAGLHAATAPVVKADLPPGASINEPASERLRMMAAGQIGTTLPAIGARPTPGVLPDASAEAPADPIRFQFPWGGNVSYTPRSGYGTPFAQLRSLASVSPEIFTCIQCRKDQMASLEFDFSARDKKSKGAAEAKIAQARVFFATPDRLTPFKTWIQTGVDEVLTIDALSIFKRRTRGGQLYGYEIIDGSTIKVLLDDTGNVPLPPAIAYRQIIYGAPMTGGDCTRDELLYLPKTVRTWSPYGMSPTEAVLLIVSAALNRTLFNLSYYIKGNIPEALVGVPNTWSPKQIQQFMEYWNLVLQGDPSNRAGLRFVTETMASKVHEFRKADFSTVWELWLLKVICACFGVTPSEIGFTDDVNKATSKTQGDVNQRRGVKPMANFWKGIFDTMLATDLGMPELETTWSGGEGEDALSQAKIIDLQLRSGVKSLDEIRSANGDPTLGIGPAVVTPTGPIFWEDALEQADAAASAAANSVPPDSTDDPTASQTDTATTAQQAELKKYQTVAVKAARAGLPVPSFSSTILGRPLHHELIQKLASVQTVADVQAVFAGARARIVKAQRLSTKQKHAQARMNTELKGIFAELQTELAQHVKHGIEGRA